MRAVILENSCFSQTEIEIISRKYGFQLCLEPVTDDVYLQFVYDKLQLCFRGIKHFEPLYVDFTTDKFEYRRKMAGGRKQALAKAMGLKNGINPLIIDATAGLGREAFILASLGCYVHMLERNPVIAALLEDGLRRAKNDVEFGPWISERLSFTFTDSRDIFNTITSKPDIIYLDPMFPQRKKSALVKKDMQVLQEIVGPDENSDALFKKAVNLSVKRVVVKRPAGANPINERQPDFDIKTKLSRFDIYLP